ncbi:MAG TPA: DsbA family oxidoreductase [Burkholderiaceae bacterium]
MNERLLTIDVWFDLICPWCLIGKRQLEQARAEFAALHPEVAVELRWHSLQLLPHLPEEGVDFRAFYRQRLGGDAAVAARQAQVREAGRPLGLDFAFERIERMPNTLSAHGLVADARAQAGAPGAEAILEALFTAYFQQGADLGDPQTLACIAEERGLQTSAQRPRLPPEQGISGVPCFVFNGRHALSGAQPARQLLDAMRAATQMPAEAGAANH